MSGYNEIAERGKLTGALLGIVDELRAIKGVINAGISSQSMTHEVLVKMARLEERMEQTNRSLGNLQKTLVGLVISVLLALVRLMMDGALMK